MSEKDAPNQDTPEPAKATAGQAEDRPDESQPSDAETLGSGEGQGAERARAESKPGSSREQDHFPKRDSRSAPPPKPAGRGLAMLALLLSLLALGGVGWFHYQGLTQSEQGADDEAEALAELRAELATLRQQTSAVEADLTRLDAERSETVPALADRLASLESEQTRLQERLAASGDLSSELDQVRSLASRQVDAQESFRQRLDGIEQVQGGLTSDLAAVQSRLDDVLVSLQEQRGLQREVDRDLALKLDLIEVAALLSIGQARMELVGDRESALAAYAQASRQLATVDDRRLGQVRERLAEEQALIESLSEPEWARHTARLARWELKVDEWPLRPELGVPATPASASSSEAGEGWFSTVRQSLGQLVTVERLDGLSLDEDAIIAIREQIRLHLAAASLALQRRDTETLSLRLEHLIDLLDEFFQVDSPTLEPIRAELEAMTEIEGPAPPEGLGQAAAALDRVIEAL
jgi:uroporphyrin-3 C-methyltransferase